MYRTLAYPKFLRCLSDRCIRGNDIICDFNRTLFDIIFQIKSPRRHCFYNVCERNLMYVCLNTFIFFLSNYFPDTIRSQFSQCNQLIQWSNCICSSRCPIITRITLIYFIFHKFIPNRNPFI